MKKITLLLFPLFLSSVMFGQLNMSYVGDINYTQDLSDVWGYQAPDGTEYAIVGVRNGTSIVSLADPSNPTEVDFVPGPSTTWRDIKTWGDFAYVTNETSNGIHVIDLSFLPDSVTAEYWAPALPIGGTINSCHNLWIDEFGVAYFSGCNVNGGGLIYADVATNPGNPIYLGAAPPVYSHDVYVRNNLAYDAQISQGVFTIYDVSDKTNTQILGSQSTEFSTTHNLWLSDDNNTLFTTDETGNGPVGSYDVSDPMDIKELDQFRPLLTLGDGVTPHNVHVWDDYLIISYYTDGCILVDAARPDNLIEVGNFDTYIPPTTGFNGAWGAYPFLPSGLVLVSDIGNGLYVLEPNYVRACYLEGKITDAGNGAAIFGAKVDLVGDLAFGLSDLMGDYGTGTAIPGTYDVEVSKPGYNSKIVSAELENGVLTELNVELEQLPSFALTGKVVDANTVEGVVEAKVRISNEDFEFEVETDASGNFTINTFFAGTFEVIADKWGYKASIISSTDLDASNNNVELEIEEGIEDVFSLDLGWVISGNVSQGAFELGDPIGVVPPQVPILIQPEDDVDEDVGNSCYVTGNTSDVQGGIQINGTTRITSPEFDLSQMNDPYVSFHYWIFNVDINTLGPGNDRILVKLDNGTQTTTVGEYQYASVAVPPLWEFDEIKVSDFIEPSTTMKISFEIGDFDPGFTDGAEVAIDYFQAWDADPVSGLDESPNERILLTISPNPTKNEFFINYELDLASEGRLKVFNVLGQQVFDQIIVSPEGRIKLGENFEPGTYFAKIEQEGETSKAVRMVKH